MNEAKSLALYTIGNNIVGTKLNNKRGSTQAIPIRTDYLSDLQTISTDDEIYYLYKNIADKWCFCSVFEESALLLNLDSSIMPSLMNTNNQPIVCQLKENSATFIYPLNPSKTLQLSNSTNELILQKEHYEGIISSLKADFDEQLKNKDKQHALEIQKIKDTHESVLSNIQEQYDDLAEMAEGFQKEGKMWREKFFKR